MPKSKWDELVEDYLGSLDKASTRQSFRRHIRAFATWCEHNGISPLRATTEQLRRYVNVYLFDQKQLAPSSASVHVHALRGLFTFAAAQGVIEEAPVIETSLANRPDRNRPVMVVSRESTRQMLLAVRDGPPRDKAALRLLAVCGITPGEVEALTVGDLVLGGRDPVLRVGKRQIVLDDETADALRAVSAGRAHGPLIVNQWGNPLNRSAQSRLVRHAAGKAGVTERVSPLQLRNTGIVTAIAEGAGAEAVQNMSGNADLRTLLPAADPYRTSIPPAVLVAAALASQGDEASSLLVQAERLAGDEGFHPAAAIVLAAATLERTLRELAIRAGVKLPKDDDKVTIDMLAGALRGKGVISIRQKKEIDPIADPRNDAAHGRFDRIARNDAREVVRRAKDLILSLKKTQV